MRKTQWLPVVLLSSLAVNMTDRFSEQNDYYFILYGMGPIPNNLPWERIHEATALIDFKKKGKCK